jgi:hypothetical protein
MLCLVTARDRFKYPTCPENPAEFSARPAKPAENHAAGNITPKRRQPRLKRYPASRVSFSYPLTIDL